MTSTNDGKDVKNSSIIGLRAKSYFIELYKSLESRLNQEHELGARTSLLCEAWRRVHCLCQHSAISTHPHLISWLQKHTAQTILQNEWRQLSINQDKHNALRAAIDYFVLESQEAIITRHGSSPQWETQLLQRAEWFKRIILDPWGNEVLKALLDPSGEVPSDEQIIEWLKEEQGVFFVTRLRQLASSKKTVDIALSLAAAVMERVRACAVPASDNDPEDKEEETSGLTFTDILTTEAGFSSDVWELITDIEFVLLYSDRSKCIALAKKTQLRNGYQLVERLHCRLEILSHEKRLWKNAKDVAILIAQVMVARCMVVPMCVGIARTALYGCSRSLVKLLPAERLQSAMAALAAPAATSRHLHTLAVAVDAQCKNEHKPFVCELYIRAITAGVNELERLKLIKEKECEARAAERVLSSWFTSLGALLVASARLAYECALTAFSLHPSPAMYERIRTAPQLQPAPVHKVILEPASETNSEFGSWATDSRSQTNFVKTSETLNLKKTQHHSNVLSTAVLNEGEALGLSPELCQDLIVLLSGPRVKTLSWDMDKEILIENCRSYMERTHGGTRALTTELKYLNLEPDSFTHLREEEDEEEGDMYYGIEKGYEHLVELQAPEEIWEDALTDPEATESCYSSENEHFIFIPKGKKRGGFSQHSYSTEEEPLDPLGDDVPIAKYRSQSSESNSKATKERSKERSKEKKKDGQPRHRSHSASKSKSVKDNENTKSTNEVNPITVDVLKILQKPKKERKKREKKDKKDFPKYTPTQTGLSRLIGKTLIKTNFLNTQQQITKLDTDPNLYPVIITDSDYDSQGKSSIASMHADTTDSDVLFDGLFDDVNLLESNTAISNDKLYALHLDNDNSIQPKSLIDNVSRAAPNNSSSCYLPYDSKYKELTSPLSGTSTLASHVNDISNLPSWCSSKPYQNESSDELKQGIKRLIEFRKHKSVTDLLAESKHKLKTEHQDEQKKGKYNAVNKKITNKFGLGNKMESVSRIVSHSPKANSVPDVTEMFLNKKLNQQLHHHHQVDNYFDNPRNCMESQAYPLSILKQPEARFDYVKLPSNSAISSQSATITNINNFQQNLFNMLHQSKSDMVNGNVPTTSHLKESTSDTNHNKTIKKNVSTPEQKKMRDFLKELHRSNNAGVSKNYRRVTGLKIDATSASVPTNYSSKQIKPSKKVENAPNTFARLKYMHKNKQRDNLSKQNNSYLTQNKLHIPSMSEPDKDKSHIIDSLLSRVDCTVIRKVEKNPQKTDNFSKDCPPTASLINSSRNVTKKAAATGEKALVKSNSFHSYPTLTSAAASTTQLTRTSIPRTIPSYNEDQFRQLVRQNSTYFATRPQIRPEVDNMNKGKPNIQYPSSQLPLKSQNLGQQPSEEIFNRLQGCPIKIQPCQNVLGHIKNGVTVQFKSPSIKKIKDVSTKSYARRKSAVNNNTKDSNISARSKERNVTGQQNWESVLNDLLSHKTPPRVSTTHGIAFNNGQKETQSNSLCEKSINSLDSSTDVNYKKTDVSKEKDFNTETAIKQSKHVIQQKPRCNVSVDTNAPSVMNNTPSLNNALYTSYNGSPVINQTFKLNDQSSLRKFNQAMVSKRVVKKPEVKLTLEEDSNTNVSQLQKHAVMSNVSEYDMLGELMDDDLRQEIGELTSDEENFCMTNVTPKGRVKGLSSKLMNLVKCPDSSGTLNVSQNECTPNKQATPLLRSDSKMTEVPVKCMPISYEATNVIKCKPLYNTMYIPNNGKAHNRMLKAKTCNVVYQASNPIIPLNNIHTISQSQIINSRTSNNSRSLEHNVQQSGISCTNQNVNNNSRLVTLVNQNCGNVFNAVSQQHTAVKNVVVIRPEVVYEPYMMQVHKVSETVNSNMTNLNASALVAVNAVPAISMLSGQLKTPVMKPHIISKTRSIPVPITKHIKSLVLNTGNNNNSVCSNPQIHTTSKANDTETEKKTSCDVSNLNKDCNPNNINENTIKSDSQLLNEKSPKIDNLVENISKTSVKVNHSILRNNLDGKILSGFRQKHIVKLPYSNRNANTREPEKPTIAEYRHSNELFSNKLQNAEKDSSTSHILLLNGQRTMIKEVITSQPETDLKNNDCILNESCKKEVFSEISENLVATTSNYTTNKVDLENNNSAKREHRNDKCGSTKSQTSLLNSKSYSLSEPCTMVDETVNPYPQIEVKVNDTMLNTNSERKSVSKKQVKPNLTTLSHTINTSNYTDIENSKKSGHQSLSFAFRKVEGTVKNLISRSLSEHCTAVADVSPSYPKTDVNVNNSTFSKISENILLYKKPDAINLNTSYYPPRVSNNLDFIKASTENEHRSDNFCSENIQNMQSVSKNSISRPFSKRLTTVKEVIIPYFKTDVKGSDCILNESSKDMEVLPKEQESLNLTRPCYSSRTAIFLGNKNSSAKYEHLSNSPSKIKSGVIHSESILSSELCTKVANKINCSLKTNVKFNESSFNKNCDRKVLPEVQENHSVVLPEKTILETSSAIEGETNKEFLKIREERMTRKKTAILNRQVHIFSNVGPIPLSYAPINKLKVVPDEKQNYIAKKPNIEFVCTTKTETLPVYDVSNIVKENKTSNDHIKDTTNKNFDILLQQNYNSFLGVVKNGSKENTESDTTKCNDRVQLLLSNKEVDNFSTSSQSEIRDKNKIGTKIILKVKNIKNYSGIKHFKVLKRLSKKRRNKKNRSFHEGSEINDVNIQYVANSSQNLEIEDELYESHISKKNATSKMKNSLKVVSNNKDNAQSCITGNKKKYYIQDKMYKNKINDINHCNDKISVSPEQNRTAKDTMNIERKLLIANTNNSKLVPIVNSIGQHQSKMLEAQKLAKIRTLNKGGYNEICNNTQLGLQSEQHVMSASQQVHKKRSACENDNTLFNLSEQEQSKYEALYQNKLTDAYKDIIIEELPREKHDNPLKRYICIKLANGNSFKATISGKLEVDINSLFKDPAIRSVLKSNVPSKTKCVFNIQQIASSDGEHIGTRLVHAKAKHKILETINLVSDDEEDSKSQELKTEFGIFIVRGLNDNVLIEHQKRFSQKCYVKVAKCSQASNKMTNLFEEKNVLKKKFIHEYLSGPVPLDDVILREVSDSTKDKRIQSIDIEDSSNDSMNAINKSFDIGTRSVNTPDDIELNIKELKNTLLKDLCLDINNVSDDTNIAQLCVPVTIPMDLENLKEKLLKDLCDDVVNTENIDIHEEGQNTITGFGIGLKSLSCNTLTKNLSVNSTSSNVRSTKYSSKNTKGNCGFFSTIQDQCDDSRSSENVVAIKAVQKLGNTLPTPKCQHLLSGEPRAEKCDVFVEKDRLLKCKQCFVVLKRCDKLITSEVQKTHEKNIIEHINLNETGQELNNTETLPFNDLDTSNYTLKRSGSFSILNDINLYDQSLKLLILSECDVKVKLGDKLETHYEEIVKKHEDFDTCQSDWCMTKFKFHYLMKQIQHSDLPSDDSSTVCDSDCDDLSSNISESILDCIEDIELPVENNSHQMPSLLQVTLKFIVNSIAFDDLKSNESKSSKLNCSSHHLKRKLSVPENTLSDGKLLKLNNGIKFHVPDKEVQKCSINFSNQCDINNMKEINCMSTDINENNSLSENIQKINGHFNRLDKVNVSCKKLVLNLNSDIPNDMLSTKDSEKIYTASVIIDKANNNTNIHEIQNAPHEYSEVITTLHEPTLKELQDELLNSNDTNINILDNTVRLFENDILNNVQSKDCIITKEISNDNSIFIRENTEIAIKSFVDKSKHECIKNNLGKMYDFPDVTESNISSDFVSCNKHKDVIESKSCKTPCPTNITLLYENDPKIVLTGSIVEDPIQGTCYVFPVIDFKMLGPLLSDNEEYNDQDDTTAEVCIDRIQNTDLVVTKPKATYSKKHMKLNYFPRKTLITKNVSTRNLKRKVEYANGTKYQKKYRKRSVIDNPKTSTTSDTTYSNEFKRMTDYSNITRISCAKKYYLTQVEDLHRMLKDWPIKESNLSTSKVVESESSLFMDIERNTIPDPLEQTFAEEILSINDKSESTSSVINENNISVGFGEESGRVDQNLIDEKISAKISAVTLSDVKPSQPFLQSINNNYSYMNDISDSREKQLRVLDKFNSYIKHRDQVQTFFKKTTAELNNTWLKGNFELKKGKSYANNFFETMSNFPFDLTIPDFFEPPLIENIVQVVQVGQLPVSTGAQNPVTCDPRVTQVTDASPPQCSAENIAHDDVRSPIKSEYTELTTADISLPLISDYNQNRQRIISASQNSKESVSNDNITIETEVKIEVVEEVTEIVTEQTRYDHKDFPKFPGNQINNPEYSYHANDIKVPIKNEQSDIKIGFIHRQSHIDIDKIPDTYELQEHQQNASLEKSDQLAHAMCAAGIKSATEPAHTVCAASITTTTEATHSMCTTGVTTTTKSAQSMCTAGITTRPEPVPDRAMDLSNSLPRNLSSDTESNDYHRSNVTPMTFQQTLSHILPSSINQRNESENNPQVSVSSQILHIVHGKNTSLNQITLSNNTQQSVISTATPSPVLHIVQSKNGPTCSSSHASPVHNSNSYSSLSLVDGGLSGGNQLLHIVNTGNQKSNNATQLLKRVNLLTNLTNVQGSNEQKMVQFVCKSTDAKGIHLNTNQRGMVLRLHTIESPQSTPLKPESQDSSSRESPTKECLLPQELKSRSMYEENYAKFIQSSSKPVLEKSTTLPKFNQAFGKPVFQEENQKSNEIEANDTHLSPEDNNIESNDCRSTASSIHMDNIRQITSPSLLLRKTCTYTAAQQNLVQQIKQAITPMNIQTMHGGVIYTRQIPVNIGGGQTINLITVPTTERIDDSVQKQKADAKLPGRSEIEPSIIKIVPQSTVNSNSEVSADERNNTGGITNENVQNSQPPPMFTQMRIKLPMLSKTPQMVSAARVVRPSFFQIQRNVIGGPNQPVYQQLVLTAAPMLGQQSIRLPHVQTSREMKVGSESQSSPESQMSSSTLEQLREFDMVLEQVKERSTVQPNCTSSQNISKSHVTTDTTESVTKTTPSEITQQVLYSIGNNQSLNVAYVNRKSTVVSTSATTSFARSPDSSGIVDSPTSSQASSTHASHTVTSETTNGTHSPINHHKSGKVSSKSKSKPKTQLPQFKINAIPPKPTTQKPMEDEQTTQRILYILAEYKEQVENSPDKDKPAPRRRTNLQASVTPPGGSKRKKSSSCSRRSGRDSSPFDDNCRTMGSEDSSCGTSQGDCNESCQELNSPQGSPRKIAKKIIFEQDSTVSQPRTLLQQTQLQPQLIKQSQHHLQRNLLVTDGPTIAVTRAAPGKPATAVLMPANYILPVSMVKSGQQIAIVTNRGPKILTVGGGEGGATNALLFQRLSPTGLKPILTRPGVRHIRLPTATFHNLQNIQAFNFTTAASTLQTPETAASPVSAKSPAESIGTKTPCTSWTSRNSEEVKPRQDSSSEQPKEGQEPQSKPEVKSDTDPETEPWNVPHDYSYEETVRTEMDRTVLDAIPDRYSPDMEAQRIFDKMFDVESKKGYIDSQDDSPHCPYDIDASDCDDKAYHQVVQRRDGVTNRHRFVSAATLRQKFALMEDELRLQKSLSEECEDLGVDSPSASDLFPEAELLFSSSPAHEVLQQSHTPQPVHNQSTNISKPDLNDQAATDQIISREETRVNKQANEIDLGLEDVGIVTVSEDGMRATISLDHEEFVRSHPNTTFHSELSEEGEVQPVTLADLKARHITSTIFHAGRAPATVLVTAPQTTVISQATPDGVGVDHVRCSHADTFNRDQVTRFDILNENREQQNTPSAIIHSTGNATQVIRRVCYERDSKLFLHDNITQTKVAADTKETVDNDRSSPERHSELFWESAKRRDNKRTDFSSDSDKCCKSPYEENNSTDSSIGVNMRLDSVIKDARGIDRSDSNGDETVVPPLRTYPPKRTYHHDSHRSISGRTKTDGQCTESLENKRRASNRGVVKRGCHCCNGTPAPSKPKKPRQRKPTLDFN